MARGNGPDCVHSLLLEGCVPRVLRVRSTAVVDPGDVGEDAADVGAGTEGVSI